MGTPPRKDGSGSPRRLTRLFARRDYPIAPPKLDASIANNKVSLERCVGGGCSGVVLDEKKPLAAAAANPKPVSCLTHVVKEEYMDMDVDCENEVCGGDESSEMRRRVKDLLQSYRELLEKLRKENERKPSIRKRMDIYRVAAKELASQGRWLNSSKRLGAVPGVEVGDEFGCRAEMRIVGLHCQFECGIDYMHDGAPIATSIVESGRYENSYLDDNFLMYSGCGGNPTNGRRKYGDQKLEGGNLALKNSISRRTPVRVISKNRSGHTQFAYKYRGLYMVEDLKQGRSQNGKLAFKFLMRRIEGQPKVNWEFESKLVNWVLLSDEGGLVMGDDAGEGKNIPIRKMTGHAKSPTLADLTDVAKPNVSNQCVSNGRARTCGCSNSEECSCKIKYGGRLQYGCGGWIGDEASLEDEASLADECRPRSPALPFLHV